MEKSTNRVLNEMLVKLFNKIMDAEEKAVITEEYKDITNNDMHIIEAIGIEEPRRMSDIAKRLNVTMGTWGLRKCSIISSFSAQFFWMWKYPE